MRMNVGDAGERLAGQAGRVPVVDVRCFRVEDVEQLENQAHTGRQPISELAVPKRGALRRHRAILDEWPRAEVPHSQASRQPVSRLGGGSRRNDAIERTGYVRTGRIDVAEPS